MRDNHGKMNIFRISKFILFLALSIAFINNAIANNATAKYTIIFDSSGKLISSPPQQMNIGDKLEFMIYFEPVYIKKQLTKLLDHHFETYEHVHKLLNDNKGGVVMLQDASGKVISLMTYGSKEVAEQSLTRDPDGKGGFVLHSIAKDSGRKLFSPGTTITGNPRLVAGSSIVSAVIINEIYADLKAGQNGDANRDGITDNGDKFVEIVNMNNEDVDISGWRIFDGFVERYVFPKNTKIESGKFIVVFGGGNPIGIPGKVFVASPNGLGMDNEFFDSNKLEIIKSKIGEQINCIMDENRNSLKNWHSYYLKRLKTGIPPSSCNTYVVKFNVPKYKDCLKKKFIIDLKYFNMADELIKVKDGEETDTISVDFASSLNQQGGQEMKFSKQFKIPNRCFKIVYQLREVNSYFDYISNLQSNPARDEIFKLVKNKQILSFLKNLKNLKKKYQDWKSGTILKTGNSFDPNKIKTASQEIKIAVTDFERILKSNVVLNEWMLNSLWFTKGKPKINPIKFTSDEYDLTVEKSKLGKLEKIVEILNKPGEFGVLGATGYNPNISEQVARLRLEHERQKKKTKKVEENLKENQQLSKYDVLLYKGLMYVSDSYYMQHHNAQNDYLTWQKNRIKEINEEETLFILVENEKTKTELILDFTITPIELDKSILADQALKALIAPSEVSELRADDAVKLRPFIVNYLTLTKTIETYPKRVTYTLPIDLIKSTTPNLNTKLIPHEAPYEAPAKVEYTIKKTLKGKEDEELWKGEYRINKLYRVRIKTGFVYSFLKKKDFTINEDSEEEDSVDSSESTHGVDGTFGIQIYTLKRDIRKNGQWDPILYLGFSMRDPLKNLYIGGGFEPFSGLTFIIGGHLGETEKLIKENGIPINIEPKWKFKYFFAITVDASLFTELLGLKSTID